MDAMNGQAQPDAQPNTGMGAMSGMKRRFSRYGQSQGQPSVPGNEPGGANGAYGGFGQVPGHQPSSGFDSAVDGMKRGFNAAQSGAPGAGVGAFAQGMGQMAAGLHQRYGQQGRMDHAMNQNSHMMRNQDMAAGMGQMMNPAVQGDQPGDQPQPQVEPQQQSAQPDQQMPAQATGQLSPQQQAQPEAPQPQTAQAMPPAAQSSQMDSPFGRFNFGQQPSAMKHGGMVTKPTLALIGEDGPEAVVPMSGRTDARITPDMMQPRDTFQTGTSSLHNPLHGLRPVSGPMSHGGMNFKRYNAMHPKV